MNANGKTARFAFMIVFMCMGLVIAVRAQTATPTPDDVPERMPILDEGGNDIVNILLLGSDTANSNNVGRTDVLLIFSINRTAGTVALLSLPRDLYVYIPDYQVYRINSAYGYGEQTYGEGLGAATLVETVEYNLGLTIDHWARVDFTGFRRLVDDLGGVTLPVDCGIEDWRLIDPTFDPTLEESWVLYTLPVGVHQMDGDLALWYARSRRTSSDFDRGRRHQAIMRALWHRVRDLSLIDQIADLWPQLLETVETDMTLDDIAALAPLALTLDSSRLASYVLRPNVEVRSWRSPEGSSVQAPIREALIPFLENFLRPPTENQMIQEQANIEIVNATGIRDMGLVAADRLGWEGFVPTLADTTAPYQEWTSIYDYTGQSKGSSLAVLQAILRVDDSAVALEPDGTSAVDFRVVLGGSYYACTHNVVMPQPPTEGG